MAQGSRDIASTVPGRAPVPVPDEVREDWRVLREGEVRSWISKSQGDKDALSLAVMVARKLITAYSGAAALKELEGGE